jgi:hypothetical protein
LSDGSLAVTATHARDGEDLFHGLLLFGRCHFLTAYGPYRAALLKRLP